MYAFVLLGVSGSRMSTVGIHIAARLAWPYLEEDDYYSPASLKRMYEGLPLSEADRAVAIDSLSRAINNHIQPCVIVACSMLTRCLLRHLEEAVQRPISFIYLRASPEVLSDQLSDAAHMDTAHPHTADCAVVGESIEVDASSRMDVVTTRVISRVRSLTGCTAHRRVIVPQAAASR